MGASGAVVAQDLYTVKAAGSNPASPTKNTDERRKILLQFRSVVGIISAFRSQYKIADGDRNVAPDDRPGKT